MSVSMVITNATASPVHLNDCYATLPASGTLTIVTSVSGLDGMQHLKELIHAGTVNVVVTASADNVDIMSVPMEQHGVSAALAVDAIAVVTATITFPEAFPAAPKVFTQIVQAVSPNEAWKGVAYVRSVTATNFLLVLDVTTAEATAGSTATVNWMAVY